MLKGWAPYLWREWITSVDHKHIGVMYVFLAAVMLLRGFIDAIMMRSQQALAFQAPGYLPPDHYDQIFSAHGTLMIFFVAMPFVIGLINIVVPLQLGVRDVAFPTLNSVSFWLTATGALLNQHFAGGWRVLPRRLAALSAAVGARLFARRRRGLLSVVAADFRRRHAADRRQFRHHDSEAARPGHDLYAHADVLLDGARRPCLLIVAAFPILTATLAMLLLDRYLGFHFFTNEAGGNVMMYMNLIWVWGHPEVYILILPAFGVFSEVVSTFSGKPLFGYRSMVSGDDGHLHPLLHGLAASLLHHGRGRRRERGVRHHVDDHRGPDGREGLQLAVHHVRRPRPLYVADVLWSIGFIVTFVIGGMTGVLLAVPPADFVLHNSLFLVAHFHNVIIGGVLFGAFAGYTYWFPKAFGFRLDERLGKAAFWCWFIGFYLAFMPLYVVGLMGMTRRMQHYDVPAWHPWLLVAAFGAAVILGRHRAARSRSLWSASAIASSFATRPATPGTAARWNGRPRRRRPLSTSPCCRRLKGRTPIGG